MPTGLPLKCNTPSPRSQEGAESRSGTGEKAGGRKGGRGCAPAEGRWPLKKLASRQNPYVRPGEAVRWGVALKETLNSQVRGADTAEGMGTHPSIIWTPNRRGQTQIGDGRRQWGEAGHSTRHCHP
jgi:hypothetical protein